MKLNFSNKPKLNLVAGKHLYYYVKDNKTEYLKDYISISELVNEYYYLKNNLKAEYLPYHWKKEYLKLHSDNTYLLKGAYIHKLIAENNLPKELEWIKEEIPTEIKGKVEYGMFSEDTKVNLVGACDLLNIENDQIVIYEYKNSYNPQTKKQLIEKGQKQLFLYGYLCYQYFQELNKDEKIKLVMLVFEHYNKNTLRFEWEVNLKDIVEELRDINSLWLGQKEMLKEAKLTFIDSLKIENVSPLLAEIYKLKNDFEFQQKIKKLEELEKKTKELIKLNRDKNPDLITYVATEQDQIFGYTIKENKQLDKNKWIGYLEAIVKKYNDENTLKDAKNSCLKPVVRYYWKEEK